MNKPVLPEHRWGKPTDRRDELFTFGLNYDGYLEEIDLYAPNAEEALTRVKLIAESDYDNGYTRIVPMDPGGSAGLVTFIRLDPLFDSDSSEYGRPETGTWPDG